MSGNEQLSLSSDFTHVKNEPKMDFGDFNLKGGLPSFLFSILCQDDARVNLSGNPNLDPQDIGVHLYRNYNLKEELANLKELNLSKQGLTGTVVYTA